MPAQSRADIIAGAAAALVAQSGNRANVLALLTGTDSVAVKRVA